MDYLIRIVDGIYLLAFDLYKIVLNSNFSLFKIHKLFSKTTYKKINTNQNVI